jgi:hypothetical protein
MLIIVPLGALYGQAESGRLISFDFVDQPIREILYMVVPFTTRRARDAVEERREVLGNPKHAIPWDKQSLQGICGETEIEEHTLFIHVYYNMVADYLKAESVVHCPQGASSRVLAYCPPPQRVVGVAARCTVFLNVARHFGIYHPVQFW